MSKCQEEELERLPQVGRWLRLRGRQPDQSERRPLEGMQIALTLNRMVRDRIDPGSDEDDLCYT